MDVSAANSGANAVSAWGSVGSNERGAGMQAALGAVSQLLGMSQADLQKALASGQSMTSLAQAKGISTDTLVSTIKQAIQQSLPAGAPALSDDVLTRMADRISQHTGPVGGGHRHHHHHSADSSTASPPTSSPPTSSTGTSSLNITL